MLCELAVRGFVNCKQEHLLLILQMLCHFCGFDITVFGTGIGDNIL